MKTDWPPVTAATRGASFARKGEARPVGTNAHDRVGGCGGGGAAKGAGPFASVLSGLIRRQLPPVPGGPVISAAWSQPGQGIAPGGEPELILGELPAGAVTVRANHRRRRVTVRLDLDDFRALDRIKQETGATYQSLVEMAVRFRYRDPD